MYVAHRFIILFLLLFFPLFSVFEHERATQAYQAKNDYTRVLTYGELTLAENEDNLMALLILAAAIPERTQKSDLDREEKLSEAGGYAKRVLEVLSRLPKPASLSEEEWKRTREDTEATARAASGLIAMIREDLAEAELQLRRATELALRPDPITLYRLGLCYSLQKKYDLALEVLERAASSGGVKISDADGQTRDLVVEAKEFALKAKEATGTHAPVSGATPGSVAGGP